MKILTSRELECLWKFHKLIEEYDVAFNSDDFMYIYMSIGQRDMPETSCIDSHCVTKWIKDQEKGE